MPPSEVEDVVGTDMALTVNSATSTSKNPPEPLYKITQFEEPFFLVSLFRQIRQRLHEPKVTVPSEYYQGEARLPVTEMSAWYQDLPGQLRFALQKPTDEIGAFNYEQERRRLMIDATFLVVGAITGWLLKQGTGLLWGVIAGAVLGRGIAVVVFKKRSYPPDFWRDYRQQPASWVNS